MNCDKPLLSILIPTRNRAYYLRYAIQSALNVASADIEIIVSENYGSDDGWEVANSFSDSRLSVVRPGKPLPMHENWEFLLGQSKGRWITFIGDDDAVMPHCADYLSYLDYRYPEAEAIVSPRAYYFWEHAYSPNDKPKCFYAFSHQESWQDSKQSLRLCLKDKKEYIYLPQIYAGGFHRRSLVQRVIRLQGGHYFRSVTPDAYSAVVATLHTYRYLKVGVPMTWVGTSPSNKVIQVTKDKDHDFYGMHSESFSMHASLGDEYKSWPFVIHFFEAYLAAAPFVDLSKLSWAHIRRIYRLAAKRLILRGDLQASRDLAFSLGLEPLDPSLVTNYIARAETIINKILRRIPKSKPLMAALIYKLSHVSTAKNSSFELSCELVGEQYPNILSADFQVAKAFKEYASIHLYTGS